MLISKVIANRMKSFLSVGISKEHFGFLFNRQILDAIGSAQEVFHSVKSKKSLALILKLDLEKAYDMVNWAFLRLVLLQIGLSLLVTNGIMACVYSGNFALLFNGSPIDFFKASRGVRQACPLSPYLFLLVIEGLGRSVLRYKSLGLIQGVKVIAKTHLTHLLFVDDVMTFGAASLNEWRHFKDIPQTFCKAIGMKISDNKFVLMSAGGDEATVRDIFALLNFQIMDLNEGMKYLGYYIEPNNYKIVGWR